LEHRQREWEEYERTRGGKEEKVRMEWEEGGGGGGGCSGGGGGNRSKEKR
jgi:hypothetical protein